MARGISDIVSNALSRGLDQRESRVKPFLAKAKNDYATADELIESAADEFGVDRAILEAQVRDFLHCNCDHGDANDVIGREKEGELPSRGRFVTRERYASCSR